MSNDNMTNIEQIERHSTKNLSSAPFEQFEIENQHFLKGMNFATFTSHDQVFIIGGFKRDIIYFDTENNSFEKHAIKLKQEDEFYSMHSPM